MKILQVHNKYKKRGGEETVVEQERNILIEHGHKVVQYIRDSSELDHMPKSELIKTMFTQRRSRKVAEELKQIIESERPDICHVHNVFPLITPSVYYACKELKVPVVQTVHNYKLLCTNSLLFRNGEVCEQCVGHSLYRSIKYKCYRDSYLATALTADALEYNRKKGTWKELIDKYVCLTEFQKEKLVEGGLPADKITIKPNFTEASEHVLVYGEYILFIGRLDDSKGLQDLLFIIEEMPDVKFTIIGASDNPEIFSPFENVNYLGQVSRGEVLSAIANCRAVIFPSKYYEGMPMVIIEAFSLHKSVIARDTGSMSSMIDHEVNGLKYSTRGELKDSVELISSDLPLAEKLGNCGHRSFLEKYSVQSAYINLINLYETVLNGGSKIQ